MNLARIKFFGLFIFALCRVQTVCFEKLVASFDADVMVDSSLRRIQRVSLSAGYKPYSSLCIRLAATSAALSAGIGQN